MREGRAAAPAACIGTRAAKVRRIPAATHAAKSKRRNRRLAISGRYYSKITIRSLLKCVGEEGLEYHPFHRERDPAPTRDPPLKNTLPENLKF